MDKDGRAKEKWSHGGGAHVLKVELTGVAKGLDAETGWEGGYRNKKMGRAEMVTSRFLP